MLCVCLETNMEPPLMKKLLGTGRELRENNRYDKLVDKYGEYVAEWLIESQLKERDLTLKDFNTYRKVRKVIQTDGLNVVAAAKEAKELTSDAINETFDAW